MTTVAIVFYRDKSCFVHHIFIFVFPAVFFGACPVLKALENIFGYIFLFFFHFSEFIACIPLQTEFVHNFALRIPYVRIGVCAAHRYSFLHLVFVECTPCGLMLVVWFFRFPVVDFVYHLRYKDITSERFFVERENSPESTIASIGGRFFVAGTITYPLSRFTA